MYRLLLRRPARLLRSHADAAAFQELRCAFPDDRQPVLGRATSRWSRAGPGRDRLIHVRLGPVRQPVEGGGEPAHLRHQEASEPHLRPTPPAGAGTPGRRDG